MIVLYLYLSRLVNYFWFKNHITNIPDYLVYLSLSNLLSLNAGPWLQNHVHLSIALTGKRPRWKENRLYTIHTECISVTIWISIAPNTEPEGTYFGITWNNFLETKQSMQLKSLTYCSRNVFFRIISSQYEIHYTEKGLWN